ncbi:polyhydroxyalkanoate synthesis repressor PhaR [Gallibacterium anatis]|uniref:UDP-N-acetylglucosamine 2-epimerase n=1 Tax=Gallibacterium anatis TaxID=750 RepID=UPI000531997F|nr:UDP-N-acetylglucosamine 2-epimerase [Gallibacterium anatis]KGQ45298.1 polyhydroxyalkanoate synthesis repressor PhaR [Gallibacterium anatis]KGQ51287.1 polyhydroxyalkanoate synthesis repressor PhaR [Gallibacterium anatis]KGQ58752.1 polyhydroxyalkanoate synthesis repressor PhaR [Gallibacterium anatis]
MKKLAYITGSRAEYGIVKRLLLKLQHSTEIEFSVIVTAMHLDKQYGYTIDTLIQDGINISHKIPLDLDSSNNAKVIDSMAECLSAFGNLFQNEKYDAIIILGDRYEMLSVSIAAAMHNIPIIHLHGGEKTLGNYDEFIRHSITKMAKLHLVSTEGYKKRVIQLGESPDSVINIGSLGAENSLSLPLLSREYIYNKIDYKLPYFVVLFHPETISGNNISEQIDQIINAISFFDNQYDFVFIGSNSDTGSNIIYEKLTAYASQNNYHYFASLTTEEYLSIVKYSRGLIGNSSSGLIEIPSLKVATINLGDRQKGRVRGKSVIDCEVKTESIINAIIQSQKNDFQQNLQCYENPYRKENSLQMAFDEIINFINSERSNLVKNFWDL